MKPERTDKLAAGRAAQEAMGLDPMFDLSTPIHRGLRPLPPGIEVRMSEDTARRMIEMEAEDARERAEVDGPRQYDPNTGEPLYTLTELIEMYAEDSYSLLEPKPADMDDATWIKGVEDLQARLEIQYEQIIQETNVILATPEWKEYRRVCDETVERLQDEFIKDPAPVCARTIAEFHRKVDDAVNALQTFYRNKMAARIELEESHDLASLTEREREERVAAIARASTDIALDLTRGELKKRHRNWADLIPSNRIKELRVQSKKDNFEFHKNTIEKRLLAGESLKSLKVDFSFLTVRDLMKVRDRLCEEHPDKLQKRSYRLELLMLNAADEAEAQKIWQKSVPYQKAKKDEAAAARANNGNNKNTDTDTDTDTATTTSTTSTTSTQS